MRIGDVLRYPRRYEPGVAELDGLPNFHHATYLPGRPRLLLESGINLIEPTPTSFGAMRPAVTIRSSPHRAGSAATPWEDFFDPDNGHIRYFGDHKVTRTYPPEQSTGNKVLLSQYLLHNAHEKELRKVAAPLLFFLAVPHGGRIKGNVKFQGVGVIERAKVVAQWDRHERRTFPNYRFEAVVLSLARDGEDFDWAWINARRDPAVSPDDSLKLAPAAWRDWVRDGTAALPRLRRSVAYQTTVDVSDQVPSPGSREEAVLRDVYTYYAQKKWAFESLAEMVTERLLRASGVDYVRGWITPRSGDRGADFVGRVDIGSGFATARLVVLGQAKCEKPTSPTGGVHIARTAARLRRGWIGVYVTTSYFSRQVQGEVREDEYPLVLVNGLQLSQVLLGLMFDRGLKSVRPILRELEAEYESRVSFRRPVEIMLD